MYKVGIIDNGVGAIWKAMSKYVEILEDLLGSGRIINKASFK
jgi:hypothetical protein